MKIKRRWFSSYVNAETYERFYSQVKEAKENNNFKDGYRHMVRSLGGTIGGIYRALPYSDVFEMYKSLTSPAFKLRASNKEGGNIFLKRKGGFWKHSSKVAIDFYYFKDGYWVEIRSEPYHGAIDVMRWQTETVVSILDKLSNLSSSKATAHNEDLLRDKTLTDRINEVLYDNKSGSAKRNEKRVSFKVES